MTNGDSFERLLKATCKSDSTGKRFVAISVFFVIVFGIWAFWASESTTMSKWAGVTPISSEKKDALASAGSWGDSFGGFNALFGALGFAAVTATLYLQHKSLEQQRIDLHIQRFETTFFELMRLMRELRSELMYVQSQEILKDKGRSIKEHRGFDAVKYGFNEVTHIASKRRKKGDRLTRDFISEIYLEKIHKRYESRFAPYFRIIYTILFKIKNDPILSEIDKYYYSNILRSQLTSHEICFLAVNAMVPVAKDLFEHIIHFRMLKYTPDAPRNWLSKIYPEDAFASRD